MTLTTTFEETKYDDMQKGLNLAKQKWKRAQIAGGGEGGGDLNNAQTKEGFFWDIPFKASAFSYV